MKIETLLLKAINELEEELSELYYLRDKIEQCEMALDFAKDMLNQDELTEEERKKYLDEEVRLTSLKKKIEKEIEEKLKY